MIKVKRLRHATFVTNDLERQTDYYQSIIGLTVIAREADRVFMATESGQLSVIFEKGSQTSCNSLALEVAPGLDLADLQRRMSESGVAAEIRSDPLPGIQGSLRFNDLEGRQIELFSGSHFHDNCNLAAAISPLKLGHMACYTADPEATSRYYGDVLGFRVSDWIEDRFVFMRCNHEHHTVNFAQGPNVRMHHIAFELRDAAHMHRACDWLGRNRIEILWGPVRHGPGHNVAIYHRDPDGHVIELFYDLDNMTDEDLGYYDPRPWHRDRPQKPKVWVGLPRDVWGQAPNPALTEFARKPQP